MNKGKSWVVLLSVFLVFLIFGSFVHSGDKDELESLRGLKGIYVLIENLPADIEEKGGLTKDQIRTDIELKLRLAGIKVVSREERSTIPGWPCLYVNINPMKRKTELVVYAIQTELSQEVFLERNPNIQIKAITWSRGMIGTVGEAKLSQIRTSLKDLIDEFINDYLSVNPTKGK